MLALMRFEGQSIMIGDNIRVVVVQAHNGRAKIAISAPKDISVHRTEVYDRIQRGEPQRRKKLVYPPKEER